MSGRIITTTIFVIGIIAISSYVRAQNADEESTLGTQIEKLATAIQAFADALQPKSQEFSGAEEPFTMETQSASDPSEHEFENVPCLETGGNYFKTWSSSFTRKTDADWAAWHFPKKYDDRYDHHRYEQFMDINGDGLVDFFQIYTGHRTDGSGYISESASDTGKKTYFSPERTCILLNNGKGWDIAYKCISGMTYDENGKTIPIYYGDCAG